METTQREREAKAACNPSFAAHPPTSPEAGGLVEGKQANLKGRSSP